MQLDDYLTGQTIDLYEMWIPKDYRAARKRFKAWIPVQEYHRKDRLPKAITPPRSSTLDAFLTLPSLSPLSSPRYLLRFRSIPKYFKEDFVGDAISDREWLIIQSLPSFTGFFNHMFDVNDFSMLDSIQGQLESKGVSFKHIFIHDVVAFELLRLQLGFRDYTGLEKIYRFLGGNPLFRILRDRHFFPAAADVSYVMTRIPASMLKEYYYSLVDEAIAMKIIVPRILVWDTQFIHSNCNDNKNKKKSTYNDRDAGYGRHIGKKLGVGYSVSNLYAYCGSWNRSFPIHFDVFPANRNDIPIFQETLSNFLGRHVGSWVAIIGDTGGYSLDNLDYCVANDIIPFIRAKKNLVTQPVIEIRKGYWFNSNFFPQNWTPDDVRAVHTKRPVIEAGQSANDTFYNSARMNDRGIDNAIRNRAMIYILELLRAITATKLGRADLISKLTAFSASREAFMDETWPDVARDSGYDVLIPSFLEARRKQTSDNQGQE